jgi:hypothetical protein
MESAGQRPDSSIAAGSEIGPGWWGGRAPAPQQDDPRRFISYSEWSDARARDAWKQSEGCAAGFAACRAFCDDFQGGDFTKVVHI